MTRWIIIVLGWVLLYISAVHFPSRQYQNSFPRDADADIKEREHNEKAKVGIWLLIIGVVLQLIGISI